MDKLWADRSNFEFRNSLGLHLAGGVILFAWVGILAIFIRDAYGPVPIVLWYGVAVFSFIGLHYLYQAFDQRVQVRIDQTGILDRRNGFGVVPWKEIAELKLKRRRSQWLMLLRVVHPDYFAERALPLDRFVARLTSAKPFAEIKVPLEDAHVNDDLRRFIYEVAGSSDMPVKLGT